MPERIFIPLNEVELEAVYEPGDPARAGVVAHPHPLYGGDMNNNVVMAAYSALKQAGFGALRFNFRGVGRSSGGYGQGRAEQGDVYAAAAYLKQQGAAAPLVIGYSFGGHAAAFAWPELAGLPAAPLILIAPPAAFMPFDGLPASTRVGLIVVGENDDIAPPNLAQKLGAGLDQPVKPVVVPGADHFFGGREGDLVDILVDYLK
jgi:hypothetical protein